MNAVTQEAEQTAVEAAAKPLNIYQRINEVRKAVAYVQKDEKTVGGKYRAVKHDDVTKAVRAHLIANGVVIVPRVISSVVVPTGTTTGGGVPFIRFEAMFSIGFVNMDTPTDRVDVELAAHALDEGDKAPGKATSYATKYAMLKLFSIETGEDEEDRPEVKAEGRRNLPSKSTSGTEGALETLTPERREVLARKLSSIVDCFDAAKESADADAALKFEQDALKTYEEVTDTDERIALWHMLKPHSKMRSRLKAMAKEKREAEGNSEPARDPAAHRRD